MAYTKHEWVPNELITAEKLNNMEDGIDESLRYDLVIEGDYTGGDDGIWSIKSGSILACEDMMDAGQVVNAICIMKYRWSFTPSTANTPNNNLYLPLVWLNAPYLTLKFGCSYYDGLQYWIETAEVMYDKTTGEITQGYRHKTDVE